MAQTQSADYFTGIRDSLTGLLVDFGRAKLIDVESRKDDRDIKDYVDAKLARDPDAMSGMSLGAMALIGVALVVGIIVLKKVL